MTSVHPITSKAQVGQALETFTDDVGIPAKLIFDGAGEQTGDNTDFQKTIRRLHINWRLTEPYSPWQNRAEDAIRELKRRWKRTRLKTGASPRLWDYGLTHEARILSLIARGPNGRTPYEAVVHETPDISEYLDFDFYDPVWYIDRPNATDNVKMG